MLTASNVSVESQVQEFGLCNDAPLEVQLVSNGEARQLTDNSTLHCFFGVALANGERYAVGLCASQFASVPGAKPLFCVEPAKRARPTSGAERGWSFQNWHQEFRVSSSSLGGGHAGGNPGGKSEISGSPFDVGCLAQKLAVKHLEGANKHWLYAQSTTLNKALGMAVPKFAHIFCTIVWPIELMERKQRKWEADPSTIVSGILSGAKDLKDMGF